MFLCENGNDKNYESLNLCISFDKKKYECVKKLITLI